MKRLQQLIKRSLLTLLLVASTIVAFAANVKKAVEQVTEAVTITEAIDYQITHSTTPFATAGTVDIVNTEHAVLIITKVKPSVVIKNWLSHVYINGEKAVDGENCQVKMYGRGTIIFPYDKDMRPLTCYTEKNFAGESCNNYTEGHSGGYMKTLNNPTLNNQIRSFKLKRGYMVTFAIGTGGWGYSRCFIADQEDLEIKTLPSILDQRISSYRLFKWFNAHKAGLASDGRAVANQALNSSWCYDWGQGNSSNLPDTEWVPNHIYEDWPHSSVCGGVDGSCHMKNNNEPRNGADDTPQDLNTILNNWQNIMRTGMRLCSPTSWDGSDYWNGEGFINEFLDSIDARGWRCDIVDAHGYWNEGNFNNLKDYWYPNMRRPIWISEWIWGASWSGGSGAFAAGVTDADILATTKRILNNLNGMACVERYAYWNSESKAHIYENSLTELGKYYSTMDVGLGYNPANEFIPTEPPLKNLTDFSSTYNLKKGTVEFSWSDPNCDLINRINIQCKLPGESSFTTIATLEPKDKKSADGVSYTYTDTVSVSGAHTYRIQAVAYNSKRLSTEEVTYNVAPSKGNDFIQYGNLTIASNDAQQIDFSTEMSAAPYVFIGPMSCNSNTYRTTACISSLSTKAFKYQSIPIEKQASIATTPTKEENIDFMAIVPGNYSFGNMDIEVAQATIKSDTTEVILIKPFPENVTPVVIAQLKGDTNKSFYTKIWDVTNKGFKATTFYELGNGGATVRRNQTLYYAAFTTGTECIDENDGILISAGNSEDKVYGNDRNNIPVYFTLPRTNDGTAVKDTLYFVNPYIFTTLQTSNYKDGAILRKNNNITQAGSDAVYGIRLRRQVDTAGSDGTKEATADYSGWVVVSTKTENPPTSIDDAIISNSDNTLEVDVINRIIYVKGHEKFDVYTTSGTKVASNATQEQGTYIVRVGKQTAKVLVK